MSGEMNQDTDSAFQRAVEVKDRYEEMLLSKANVVGVGVGIRQQDGIYTGEVALVVMVRQKLPSSEVSPEDFLPVEIDGIPVDVQEVGAIGAQ
jgi:hypothetical protein